VFSVSPPKANPLFAKYLVKVSPVSHKIWRIEAVAKFDSKGELEEVWRKLLDKLTDKYRPPEKWPANVEYPDTYIFKSGARKVIYHISTDGHIDIAYEDEEVAAQGKKEDLTRGDLLVDFSGL
jgi:hypothetical protein